MTTAFIFPAGASEVTLAKYAISFGKRQGSCAPCPMPFLAVAASMRENVSNCDANVEGIANVEL